MHPPSTFSCSADPVYPSAGQPIVRRGRFVIELTRPMPERVINVPALQSTPTVTPAVASGSRLPLMLIGGGILRHAPRATSYNRPRPDVVARSVTMSAFGTEIDANGGARDVRARLADGPRSGAPLQKVDPLRI